MFIQKETNDRIEEDLQVGDAMTNSMSTYLDSTAVYYPLVTATFPKLTLGGYLMRQHRLLAVKEQLSVADKDHLEKMIFEFQQTINSRVVRVEQKGQEEARIRVRQWEQAITELQETPESDIAYYPTTVENRVMLAALLSHLQQKPYQFDNDLVTDTAVVDQKLQTIWQAGEFIWPQVWQSAYPQNNYWWLYGQPVMVTPH